MQNACETFIALIESGEFYEAHEVLEAHWYPKRFEKDDETLLIKGFINASVSFELMKKGRAEPALRTWRVYLKYRPLLKRLESRSLPLYRRVDKILETTYERLFRA